MKVAASEFKAKCLALIDRVRERGEPVTITKRGRVVARLGPADDEEDPPGERAGGGGPCRCPTGWRPPHIPAPCSSCRSRRQSRQRRRRSPRVFTATRQIVSSSRPGGGRGSRR